MKAKNKALREISRYSLGMTLLSTSAVFIFISMKQYHTTSDLSERLRVGVGWDNTRDSRVGGEQVPGLKLLATDRHLQGGPQVTVSSVTTALQYDSVRGQSTCCQAGQPEFSPWNPATQ